MNILKSIFTICLLLSMSVASQEALNEASKNDLIILAGNANKLRYATISKKWYQSYAEASGSDVTIFADPQTKNPEAAHDTEALQSAWNFGSLTPTPYSLDIQFEMYQMTDAKPKDKDPIVLFINDHGERAKLAGNSMARDKDGIVRVKSTAPKKSRAEDIADMGIHPEYTRISLKEGSITHAELAQHLEESFSHRESVKIVGIHCYSGGVHEISFKNENTCSLSASDWLNVTYSSVQENRYGEGIIDERTASDKNFDFNGDGITSMLEAHFAGLAKDYFNYGRQTTSSMAYVDKVLKQGVYHPLTLDENYDPTENLLSDSLVCEANDPFNIGNELKNLTSNISPFTNAKASARVSKHAKIQSHSIFLTQEQINSLPNELQQVYQGLIDHGAVKKSLSVLRKNFPKVQSELMILEKSKRQHETRLSNPRVQQAYTEEDIAKYQKELDDLNQSIKTKNTVLQRIQARWRGFYRYFKHLKDLARFNQVASSEEKKKLANIMKCESEQL